MDRFIVICILISVVARGFLSVRNRKLKNKEFNKFTNEYFGRLKQYITSAGSDLDAYTWLIKRSQKIQNQMGPYGKLALFKAPHQNYEIQNFNVVVNILPEIRKFFKDPLYKQELIQYIDLIQNNLLSYIGVLEDFEVKISKEIKNPVIWFREGTKSVLSFPILLLNWLGIISLSVFSHLTTSFLFKFVSGIVAGVGLLSGIMSIILGWDKFLLIVKELIS